MALLSQPLSACRIEAAGICCRSSAAAAQSATLPPVSMKASRRYGRCLRGERLRTGVPHGHWKTTTFVGALTLRGFIAPFVLDGPINRDAFETYVAKVLIPDLRPGDIVVMDNLSSHKGPRVRQMIEAAGAQLLHLPPYSSDFNPIENAFSKLKALLRKAAERTVDGLWSAIGRLVDRFPPQECANYCNAAGYDATRTNNALAQTLNTLVNENKNKDPNVGARGSCPKPEDIKGKAAQEIDDMMKEKGWQGEPILDEGGRGIQIQTFMENGLG